MNQSIVREKKTELLPCKRPSRNSVSYLQFQVKRYAERMRADSPCGCANSAPCPGRCHRFLECPPARAVYDTLATLLAQRTIVGNLWTADPPDGYPQNLWSIICLAAVYAIDSGRCYIYRHTTLKGRPPDVSVGWSARKVATETLWNLLDYYSGAVLWQKILVVLNPKWQNIAFQISKYISLNFLKKNTSIGERINKIRYVGAKLWDMDGLAAPENLTTLSTRSRSASPAGAEPGAPRTRNRGQIPKS